MLRSLILTSLFLCLLAPPEPSSVEEFDFPLPETDPAPLAPAALTVKPLSSKTEGPIPGVDGSYFQLEAGDDGEFWGEIVGEPGDDDLKLLRRTRIAAAEQAIAFVEEAYLEGVTTMGDALAAGEQLLLARLESATTDADRLGAWEEYLPALRRLEAEARARVEMGGPYGAFIHLDAKVARAKRLAGEIEVLELRRKVYAAN